MILNLGSKYFLVQIKHFCRDSKQRFQETLRGLSNFTKTFERIESIIKFIFFLEQSSNKKRKTALSLLGETTKGSNNIFKILYLSRKNTIHKKYKILNITLL